MAKVTDSKTVVSEVKNRLKDRGISPENLIKHYQVRKEASTAAESVQCFQQEYASFMLDQSNQVTLSKNGTENKVPLKKRAINFADDLAEKIAGTCEIELIPVSDGRSEKAKSSVLDSANMLDLDW